MAAKKAAKKTKKAHQTKKSAPKKTARRPARAVKRKTAKRNSPKKSGGLAMTDASPSFTVNDLEKSLAWYRNVVGFAIDEKWERDGKLMGVSLQAGDVTFMIGQDDWQKGRDRRKGEAFRIYCGTKQDVDAIAAAIQARGGMLDTPPTDQPWGSRDFSMTDPDGFKITIGKETRKR
jgi:uncharacterized glyoxalase superfamily protein PhnB